MIASSPYFGEIEYEANRVITFPHGIPGFEEYRSFLLLHPEEDMPFFYLQSLDLEKVCFIVVNPFDYCPAYEFDLNEAVQEELQVDRPEQLQVFSIITVQENIEKATYNLLAPVLINTEKRIGKQIVLHRSTYSTKEPLLKGIEKVELEVGESSC